MEDHEVDALSNLNEQFLHGAKEFPDLRHLVFRLVDTEWPNRPADQVDPPRGMVIWLKSAPWREFLGRPQDAMRDWHFGLTHWLCIKGRAYEGGFYDHRGSGSQEHHSNMMRGLQRFSNLAQAAWELWERLGLVQAEREPRWPLGLAARDRWLELVYSAAYCNWGTIGGFRYLRPRESIFLAAANAMRPLLALTADAQHLDRLRRISEMPEDAPDAADARQQAMDRAEFEYATELAALPNPSKSTAPPNEQATKLWIAERNFNNTYSKLLINLDAAVPWFNHGRSDPHPAFEALVCTHDARVTFRGQHGRCWAGLIWDFAVHFSGIPELLHEVSALDRIYCYEAEQILRVATGLKAFIGDPASFRTEWRALWHDASIEYAKAKQAADRTVEIKEIWTHIQSLFDDVATIVGSIAEIQQLLPTDAEVGLVQSETAAVLQLWEGPEGDKVPNSLADVETWLSHRLANIPGFRRNPKMFIEGAELNTWQRLIRDFFRLMQFLQIVDCPPQPSAPQDVHEAERIVNDLVQWVRRTQMATSSSQNGVADRNFSDESVPAPNEPPAAQPYSAKLVGNRIDDPMPAMKMKVLAAEIFPDLGYEAAKKRILRLMKNRTLPANRTSGHGLYEVSKSAFEAIKAAKKIAFE